MKLHKHTITDESTIPSEPEFIAEGHLMEDLNSIAMKYARELTQNKDELMWVFSGDGSKYQELLIEDKFRFVIRD